MKINNAKLLFPTIIITLLGIGAQAQTAENVTGYPVLTKSYIDVEGSPYLAKDYNKGTVKVANGNTYKDVLIKYNQVDDVLYFPGKDDEVLSFADPVTEFTINYLKGGNSIAGHYRNGYPAIDKNTVKSYYEVLTDGTAQLLKRTSKYIVKNKLYNSATETQTVNEENGFYIFAGGKMTLIKKDKKFVLPALGNKQNELEGYLKAEGLNLKNDKDLVKLVVYYNSL
ncbi:hypothetical protein [Mucilaginibacter glaciei]|uniref:DKNYY family protein n=1 Tax=Mucilaginibacter glaciei TaxID=2772109 RepID=A0A926NU98_9SPHI|nr:hypothetical protein [Mucilaginibacter glaciei]MBD1391888.1 hypothetical protein [Mucilaginibacter glaciei]